MVTSTAFFDIKRLKRCIILQDIGLSAGPRWEPVFVQSLQDQEIVILSKSELSLHSDVTLEFSSSQKSSKHIVVVSGKVVEKLKSANPNSWTYRISILEYKIRFSQEINFLWTIADLHCQILDFLTIFCKGHIAQNLSELEQAFRMLHHAYLKHHLSEEKPSGLYYTPYHLMPETKVFLLKKEGGYWGTLSLYIDSPLGLPMEATFPDEIKVLRKQGRQLAEIGSLALDIKGLGRVGYSFKSFHRQAYLFKLFKTMLDYVRFVLKPTDIIIGVQLKHESLYQYLYFERVSGIKKHKATQSVPAIMMRLNLSTSERNTYLFNGGPGAYFLRTKLYDPLKYFEWTPEHLKSFLYERNHLWSNLTVEQQKIFVSIYPALFAEQNSAKTDEKS